MMVYGENFEQDPEYQSGQVNFWCVKTSKAHGPDQGMVSLEMCRDSQRTCYQEF
jgi:hypothetical protein